MKRIGFMQGRLTEKNGFFPQTFPQKEWEKEFETASELGLFSIEWMFNADDWESNPIITADGWKTILKRTEASGVYVSGICANYFMINSVYSDDSTDILYKLIKNAEKVGCKNIILPLFDASNPDLYEETGFDILKKVCNSVLDDKINILIETDVPMEKIADFCGCFSGNVGICYDIGNATGLGRDAAYEIGKYAQFIENIHLKDKKRGGTTVMLGKGDAPFKECFRQLEKANYHGHFILESYYTNAVDDTKQNFEYIKDILEK